MVEGDSLRLDTVFQALADPTRRGMLANLALGEKSVGEYGSFCSAGLIEISVVDPISSVYPSGADFAT